MAVFIVTLFITQHDKGIEDSFGIKLIVDNTRNKRGFIE
jgi:hypothetical protein